MEESNVSNTNDDKVFVVLNKSEEEVFVGSLAEVADELEIELNRKLGCEVNLSLEEKENKVIVTVVEDSNTPIATVVKLIRMNTPNEYKDALSTASLFDVLGVSKIKTF